ncbi:MAG: hypothetical protein LBH93_03325 [Chitinispirillales bacterium]|jgi:hypothetical protein|nr:hypothetical protein [Chitinispirillales bacterium]
MRKTVSAAAVTALLAALFAFSGCGGAQGKMDSAALAENSGNFSEASAMYAALALEAAPAHKLPEAQRGKILQLQLWLNEVDKYVKWLTEPAIPKGNTLKEALNGLDRCAPRLEPDNTARTARALPIDTLPAFTAQWNAAFNPPPLGGIEWEGAVLQAMNKKFSVLQLSAAASYVYDISIISRKTSRRVTFTLYPESKISIPLPPGDYSMIAKSSVDFPQGGGHWSSGYTAFPISMNQTPSLVAMDMKTKVARKQ